MIKAMSFSSSERTHGLVVLVSISLLSSAVRVAVCQGVQLQTVSKVEAQCGQNVTLTCDVRSTHQFEISLLQWLSASKTVCDYKADRADQKHQCQTTSEAPSHHRLTLTLTNVMPVDAGEYLCKLRSNMGVKKNTTYVTVQECHGSSDNSNNESHAMCSFHGVYPRGMVHWFQGDTNLTDSCSTEEEMDQRGLYNVSSTIHLKTGNLSLPYNCSLWMPLLGKYHSGRQLHIKKKEGRSSGRASGLQFTCIMIEILTMIIFI